MAFNLINHTKITGGANGGPSSAVSTLGANLYVVTLNIDKFHSTTPTDTFGNTYTSLGLGPAIDDGSGLSTMVVYYCLNPVTDANYIVSATGTQTSPGACFTAWSGAKSSGVVDGRSAGASTTVSTTIQPGTYTPNVDGCLLITSIGIVVSGSSLTGSIDSGFTMSDQAANSGTNYGNSCAYLIQTTATAKNPTFTLAGTPIGMSAVTAAFKPQVTSPLTFGYVIG